MKKTKLIDLDRLRDICVEVEDVMKKNELNLLEQRLVAEELLSVINLLVDEKKDTAMNLSKMNSFFGKFANEER